MSYPIQLDADKEGYCAFGGCTELGAVEVAPAQEIREQWRREGYGVDGRLRLCARHANILMKQSISISVKKRVDTQGDEN